MGLLRPLPRCQCCTVKLRFPICAFLCAFASLRESSFLDRRSRTLQSFVGALTPAPATTPVPVGRGQIDLVIRRQIAYHLAAPALLEAVGPIERVPFELLFD